MRTGVRFGPKRGAAGKPATGRTNRSAPTRSAQKCGLGNPVTSKRGALAIGHNHQIRIGTRFVLATPLNAVDVDHQDLDFYSFDDSVLGLEWGITLLDLEEYQRRWQSGGRKDGRTARLVQNAEIEFQNHSSHNRGGYAVAGQQRIFLGRPFCKTEIAVSRLGCEPLSTTCGIKRREECLAGSGSHPGSQAGGLLATSVDDLGW